MGGQTDSVNLLTYMYPSSSGRTPQSSYIELELKTNVRSRLGLELYIRNRELKISLHASPEAVSPLGNSIVDIVLYCI